MMRPFRSTGSYTSLSLAQTVVAASLQLFVLSLGSPCRAGVLCNFELVHKVAATLGNVPMLLSASDLVAQGPDDQAMLLYVAFLCSRLLEVSAEDRAASALQTAWRSHCSRRPGKHPPAADRCIAAQLDSQ